MKRSFVLLVLAFLFIAVLPASAQAETVVVTEAEINQLYVVQANPSVSVANTSVDLVPGQVVISATLVPTAGNTIEAKIVVVPSLDGGYLSWVVIEVLLDDQPAPDAVVSQINTALLPAWRAFSLTLVSRSVTAVAITDTEITFTVGSGDAMVTPEPAAVPEDTPIENLYVFTEAQANDTIDMLSANAAQVTNEMVDFQPGQVVIMATLVPRRGNTVDVVVTLVPEVTTEAITWTVTELLIGGQPAPDAMIELVNNSLTNRWTRYIRQQTPAGGAAALTITDDQMVFVLE